MGPFLFREIEKNLPFRVITVVSKENHIYSLVGYLGRELDEKKTNRMIIKAQSISIT